jgi:predicted Zn-ribbon and HTH transcriptional regulator
VTACVLPFRHMSAARTEQVAHTVTCDICGTFRRRGEHWSSRCPQCAAHIEAGALMERAIKLLRGSE